MIHPLPSAQDVELRVTSLGGLGDGIAELNGAPVFIPKTLPGDVITARLLHSSGDGLRAELMKLITPAPDRTTPPCQHFDSCGGCTLQHMSDDAYVAFKTKRARDAIRHAGFDENILAPMVRFAPATRRRVEFRFIHAERSTVAFQALHRHRKVAIEHCEVLAPQLQAVLTPLSEIITTLPDREAIEGLKLTLADNGVDAIFSSTYRLPKDLKVALAPKAESLGIIRANAEEKGRLTPLFTLTDPTIQCGELTIPLPADAFLQACAEAQLHLTTAIAGELSGANRVADLFSGIGVYGFALSGRHKLDCFESHPGMVKACRQAIAQHGLEGRMQANVRDLFKRPLSTDELHPFDAVILNPPRAGAKAQCEALAQSSVRQIAMVSCNPATFARDAKTLREGGFSLKSAEAIDQFRWTAHLEMLAFFEKL